MSKPAKTAIKLTTSEVQKRELKKTKKPFPSIKLILAFLGLPN
jgi:hypothetical protein